MGQSSHPFENPFSSRWWFLCSSFVYIKLIHLTDFSMCFLFSLSFYIFLFFDLMLVLFYFSSLLSSLLCISIFSVCTSVCVCVSLCWKIRTSSMPHSLYLTTKCIQPYNYTYVYIDRLYLRILFTVAIVGFFLR